LYIDPTCAKKKEGEIAQLVRKHRPKLSATKIVLFKTESAETI